MSEEDSELERLKAKRLAEMKKNISSKQEIEKTQEVAKEKPLENPRDLLVNRLGFRGLEVLENAESQFPNETKIIVEKLSELIKTGEINEIIEDGDTLMENALIKAKPSIPKKIRLNGMVAIMSKKCFLT